MGDAEQSRASGGYRSALAHRDFRLLVVSFAIDQAGSWASTVVLLAYVFDRTHSPSMLAVATAVRWIPALVASTYGGVLADRYDRAYLMQACALLSFTMTAGMVALVLAAGPLWILLMLNGATAVVAAPYRPAAGALTADVVGEKDLAAANALYALLESATVVAGPVLGGLLLITGRAELGFGTNAASFLLASLLVGQIRSRSRGGAGEHGESLVRQFTEGVRAVLGDPVARTLVLYVFLDTAVYGASSVVLIAVSVHVGTGTEGFGYLLAGQAAGGVLLAGVANRLSSYGRLAPVLVGGMLVLALPFAVLVLAGTPVVACLLQVVSGAGMVLIDVLAITGLQRDLPRAVLSRALGLVDSVTLAACLVGSVLTATLLDAAGLTVTLLVIGLGFSGVAVLSGRPLLAADRRTSLTLSEVQDRVVVLARLDLLAAASYPTLEALARDLRDEPLAAGTVLLREGEAADALWVLVSGSLSVTIEGHVVSSVEAPGYVGEIGLLHRRPRSATVTAAADSVLWRISGEDFRAALDQFGASSSITGTAKFRLTRGSARDAA